MTISPKPSPRAGGRTSERRKRVRIRVSEKATVTCNGRSIEGRMENLSTGGMFIACARQFDQESECVVKFTVWDREHRRHLALSGWVAHVKADGMGIELEELETSILSVLHRLVRQAVRPPGK